MATNKPTDTNRYTAEEWEEQKPEIARLWESNKLKGLVASMSENGFDATPKQYKDRIKNWGLQKHIQSDEMKAMIRKQREREVEEGKATAFELRGRPVEQRKIERYMKEHGIDEDVVMGEDAARALKATPADLTYSTPKDTGTARETSPEAQSSRIGSVSKPVVDAGLSNPLSPTVSTAFPQMFSGSQSSPTVGYGSQQPPPPSQPYGYYQPPPQQYGGYNSVLATQPPRYGRPGMPSITSNAFVSGNSQAPPPPPSSAQSFGGGAPQGYAFKYSNCTGRRKALLIGINYFGTRGQLRGCINDVKNMSAFLHENFGYQRDDMVILTDDQENPMSQPTKQNILRGMHRLVKKAKPNDSLFFHYSGHGGQTKDLDGDAADGYDEVIYPVDFRQVGHILDDEMHRIMVQPLEAGVRLTAIFDSCHSGTALDLPYIYSTQGILKEPNLAKEAGQGLLSVISSYSQGDLGGVASNVMGFFKKAKSGDEAYSKTLAAKTSPADVVMWSGSREDQTSTDATIAAQATGAISWAFINALKKNEQQSYVQLLNSIRDELATKYTQKPQLSCSHPLNINLLFVM